MIHIEIFEVASHQIQNPDVKKEDNRRKNHVKNPVICLENKRVFNARIKRDFALMADPGDLKDNLEQVIAQEKEDKAYQPQKRKQDFFIGNNPMLRQQLFSRLIDRVAGIRVLLFLSFFSEQSAAEGDISSNPGGDADRTQNKQAADQRPGHCFFGFLSAFFSADHA